MNKQELILFLNQAFSRKYNSLADYILSAQPYIKDGQETLLREIQNIAQEDAQARDELAQALEDLNAVPRITAHPHSVSDLAYLSLDYLGTVLAKDLEQQFKEYDSARQACAEEPGKGYFEGLCGLSRKQLERLQALID